jgi:8-oxo-dGTP pyrophosphatase MutT (NUDIX family)
MVQYKINKIMKFHRDKPDNSPNPWQTITENTAYQNPWITVSHREVLNPSGGKGIYGVVQFKNVAVGIIPLDEFGNTWIIGQFRYTLQQYHWEIPEGGCPMHTDPLAKRELIEETGIEADLWTPLLELHTSNSVTNEYGVAYIAQNLHFGVAEPEETEQLLVKKIPFSELVEMVLNGEITDALSMVAVLKTNEWIRRGIISFKESAF